MAEYVLSMQAREVPSYYGCTVKHRERARRALSKPNLKALFCEILLEAQCQLSAVFAGVGNEDFGLPYRRHCDVPLWPLC
jgi:hypothetical protein